MLTGPDVSEHQGDIDWKKVANEHEMAIVRVADGDHRDPWYSKERVKAIRDAGLLFGPYYFARVASPQNKQRDGAKEAKMALGFARSAGWRWPGDLPLVYDFELNNGQPHEKCAKHLVQFVRAYRDSEKHHPGLYTMPGFWRLVLPYLNKTERKLVAGCFLHQAEWEVQGPSHLDPWDDADIWQHTERGRSPGISGNVDMNRSVASEKRILALAKRDARPEGPPGEDRETEKEPRKPRAGRGSRKSDKEPEKAVAGKGLPSWLPEQYAEHWRKPWSDAARNSGKFRQLCWDKGFLSPNFTRKEARCNDAANTPVPGKLRANAQRQAFNLERLRHELGGKPLPILSWYRTPAHNAAVGGASQSRHMQADATDFTTQTVNSFGATKFDSACDRIYSNGGFGRYPSGSRHSDSRGSRARW